MKEKQRYTNDKSFGLQNWAKIISREDGNYRGNLMRTLMAQTTRKRSFELLEYFDLPRANNLKFSSEQFGEADDAILQPLLEGFEKLGSQEFYAVFMPLNNDAIRHYTVIGSAFDVIQGLFKIKSERSKWELVLNENYHDVYGGNITVSPDDTIKIEIVEGMQKDLAQAKKTIYFGMSRDRFSKRFVPYIFPLGISDEEKLGLKTMLYEKIICNLPKIDDLFDNPQGVTSQYLAGYYEFTFVDINGTLTPWFLDVNPELSQILQPDYSNNPLLKQTKQGDSDISSLKDFR